MIIALNSLSLSLLQIGIGNVQTDSTTKCASKTERLIEN